MNDAFALSGRASSLHHPQGVALGYVLLPLQGEALNTEARSHGEYIFKFSEDTESLFRTPWLCPAFFSAPAFPSVSHFLSAPAFPSVSHFLSASHFPLPCPFPQPCPFPLPCLFLSPVWLTSGQGAG